jgi:tRNA (mo5U34)-methyltransferase
MTRPSLSPSADDVLAIKHRWYHSIDLGDGRVTPGWIDLRDQVRHVGFPDDMRGMKALDIGMFDGFWALEMERRGAQVIGIDIDDIPPPDVPRIHYDRVRAEALADDVVTSRGFDMLKEFFGSNVERNVGSILELTPERIGGPADLAFIGALLLHLRDPVGGLEAVWSSLAPGARLLCYEPVSTRLPENVPAAEFRALRGVWTWWYANQACIREWIETAGFTDVSITPTAVAKDVTGDEQQIVAVRATRP